MTIESSDHAVADRTGHLNAVSLRGVNKVYPARRGDQVIALNDINLDVRDGEFVSLVGPSGCGKSTMLKLILGQSTATSGEVVVGSAGDAGPRIGMVFQQPLLLPWRTVRRNLQTAPDLNKVPRDDELERRTDEMLALLGLEDFSDKYPKELSGGMQQRVGIGRAFMYEPETLLMDEPFGALDAMTRDQMGLELLSLWERDRKTVVFVTHSIPESVLLSDRVVVMTPRPGEIADVIDIELPRPRSLADINTPEFGVIVQRIRKLLNSENSAH